VSEQKSHGGYQAKDFISTYQLTVDTQKNPERSRPSVIGSRDLSLDLGFLSSISFAARIREEEEVNQALNKLRIIISKLENQTLRDETIKKNFLAAIKQLAKNDPNLLCNFFFGRVYPAGYVVSNYFEKIEGVNKDQVQYELVPAKIMDGRTTYGGFFNNSRLVNSWEKNPNLGLSLMNKALKIYQQYLELTHRFFDNGQLESTFISLINFINHLKNKSSSIQLSKKLIANFCRETLLLVNMYNEFNQFRPVSNHNLDILKGFSYEGDISTLDDLETIIGDLLTRVLNRNNLQSDSSTSASSIDKKIVDTGDVFAPDVLLNVLRGMN
jgi:hypothetical protein